MVEYLGSFEINSNEWIKVFLMGIYLSYHEFDRLSHFYAQSHIPFNISIMHRVAQESENAKKMIATQSWTSRALSQNIPLFIINCSLDILL